MQTELIFRLIPLYEAGELEHEDVVRLFQALVDTGLAWTLQGTYGRTAEAMIEAGEITLPAEES